MGKISYRVLALVLFTAGASVTALAEIVGGGSCTQWPGGRWQPDTPSYGIELVTGVPIVMDDGVSLFADIGYPTDLATGRRATGKFPVLLAQNTYGFTPPPDVYFVGRGYIYINVDVRGTLRTLAPNNGPLVNDLFSERQAKDGAALVQWASTLGGSNGTVGLSGCSQLGIAQIFTAAVVGPNSPLKAILPACAANDYRIYFAGGIPSQTISLFGLPSPLSGTLHAAENLAWGKAFAADVLSGGDKAYSREYWHERDTDRVGAQVVRNGIPALFWSGWNATESNEAVKLYALFQNAWLGRPDLAAMLPDQPTTPLYQIIIGPGSHGRGLDEGIMLEWYDTWLKGQETGLEKARSPMHLYELNTNRWVNTAAYPIVHKYTPYYLGANGTLSARRSAGAGRDSLSWGDPALSGTTLTYTTAAFSEGATLAGAMAATVYARSSNTNMELIVTLNDLAPDGTATQVTTGALLGSMRALRKDGLGSGSPLRQLVSKTPHLDSSWYDMEGNMILPRHPFDRDDYLTPGQLERMDIELSSELWSVLPGHSLQLVLSTEAPSSFCLSQLSALAKPSPCVLTAPQLASVPGGVYGVARTAASPSAVSLPLLPFQQLKEVASAVTPTSPSQTQPLDWGSPGYCGTN